MGKRSLPVLRTDTGNLRLPMAPGESAQSNGIWYQVAGLDQEGRLWGSRRVGHSAAAIVSYVQRFGPVGRAAVEAGNGTAAWADELRQGCGWPVPLAHPGYVRRMKQNPDQSDYCDARLLADLCRVGYVPPVWLAPPAIRERRRLVRHRQALVDQARAVKLRVSALLRDHRVVRPGELQRTWTRRHRDWRALLLSTEWRPPVSRPLLADWRDDRRYLESRIARADMQLRQAVAADPLLDWLLAQPCVGLLTAGVLRAEIGEFGRFRTGQPLARYGGVIPSLFRICRLARVPWAGVRWPFESHHGQPAVAHATR